MLIGIIQHSDILNHKKRDCSIVVQSLLFIQMTYPKTSKQFIQALVYFTDTNFFL